MRNLRIRGSSLIELALLTPLMAALSFAFIDLGALFVRQVQLERLSSVLARELAALPHPEAAAPRASEYLAERGLSAVEATVDVRTLPGLLRPFPRRNEPVLILSLTLQTAARGPLTLRAHARELVL